MPHAGLNDQRPTANRAEADNDLFMQQTGKFDIMITSRTTEYASLLTRIVVALCVLAAAGCVGPLAVPPMPSAPQDEQALEAPFPNLNSVPGPPDLTNTLAERRKEVNGMEAYLLMTKYRGDQARYESGLRSQPPIRPLIATPTPLPTPRPERSKIAKEDRRSAAERYVSDAVFRETNDGDLTDFLDLMERGNLAVRRAVPREVSTGQVSVTDNP